MVSLSAIQGYEFLAKIKLLKCLHNPVLITIFKMWKQSEYPLGNERQQIWAIPYSLKRRGILHHITIHMGEP